MSSQKGYVFNIQKYSVHDGPGIRTVVFLKGCPLRCKWCSNPESQNLKPSFAWNDTTCIGCKICVNSCKSNALTFTEKGIVRNSSCVHCFECVKQCPAKAMFLYGEAWSIDAILDEVEKDSLFYARSGGGLTLSGGEPLMQYDFVYELLTAAKARHIHRAMESSGFAETEKFLNIASLLNYLHMDIKHLDSKQHELFTGQPNERILHNIEEVRKTFPALPLHLRTPVIPDVNDDEELIKNIALYAKKVGASEYELLAYHKMGESKYHFMGLEYPMGDKKLDEDKFHYLQDVAKKYFAG